MSYDHRGLFTRRSLLQAGSGAAIAAATIGILPSSRPARAQGDRTVRVLSVEDPFFFSLKALVPEFEKETGLKVELESLSYDALAGAPRFVLCRKNL
jgi:multiple sugar transport system substrate-binding protein